MKRIIHKIFENWKWWMFLSITLGLAPFNPPHIIGKVKWIIGGNAFSGKMAMQINDWFDVLLHGTPWILLILSGAYWIVNKFKNGETEKCSK